MTKCGINFKQQSLEKQVQFGHQTVWESRETPVINQDVVGGNEMTWLLLIF